MFTLANSMMRWPDATTPFAPLWRAGEVFRIRIRRKLRVRQPSVLVLGLASPNLDDTTSVAQKAATEPELAQTKYIGHVLERALLHLFGLTEAGAETPWEEATSLLKNISGA